MRLIYTVFSRIYGVFRIRVAREGFRIDNLIRELAANDECVLSEELS